VDVMASRYIVALGKPPKKGRKDKELAARTHTTTLLHNKNWALRAMIAKKIFPK